jgi:hypothetical protein
MQLYHAIGHAGGVLRDHILGMTSRQEADGQRPVHLHVSTFQDEKLFPPRNRIKVEAVVDAINQSLQIHSFNTGFDLLNMEAAVPANAAKVGSRDGHFVIAAQNPRALLEKWELIVQRARTIARATGHEPPARR